jgi:ABC-2 type transport system permease protein
VAHFPGWLAIIAQSLPITQGIIVLRAIALSQQSLGRTWADGSLVLLCVNSVGYLVVGLFIFKWGEQVAKMRGSLGHY